MPKYQVMTLTQLVKHIASQLDYEHIWKSNFPNCDFGITTAKVKRYSEKQLEELCAGVSGWYGIRSFHPAMDSTTLFAIADVFGGGCDNVCRLYDGIDQIEAETAILDAITKTMMHNETLRVNMTLFVEFVGDEADKEAESAAEAGPKTIYTVCQEGICPICGGELEYTGVREDDDDGCTYPWACVKCGATGKEGYSLQFDGNHYGVEDKNGNEVKILPPR